ncbi:30S ribosomal protein S5 [Candidatus Micrarchaeota archaeon]|nr:30S ribosomal protein S5 [Candidatus Micrarchaeota archaeon]
MAGTQWVPKTEVGRRVLNGEITNIDQILESGKKILESEIIDFLLPELTEEVLEVVSTQRMTASGRKQLMKAVAILGNKNGYIGVGVGKAHEARDAIDEAINDAKRRIIKVQLGCGSWECGCGGLHSILQEVTGKSSSTKIVIKPAPKGVGIVAGTVVRKVLSFAGVKDAWTFTRGRTRNVLNMVEATIEALNSLNKLKKGIREELIEEKKVDEPGVEISEEKQGEQTEEVPTENDKFVS